MRKPVINTVLNGLITISILVAFNLSCAKKKENGFNRLFLNEKVTEIRKFVLKEGSRFYFAGSANQDIYLKDLKNPKVIYKIDSGLSKMQEIQLHRLKEAKKIGAIVGNYHGMFYAISSTNGSLFIQYEKTGGSQSFNGLNTHVNQAFLISPYTVIGRSTSIQDSFPKRYLVKLNYKKRSIDTTFNLPKLVDGYFCTDGLLKFDERASKLYYMYFYRGRFLCLDTNLQLIYQAKTIDTVQNATVRLGKIKNIAKDDKGKFLTQSEPPPFVNRNIAVDNNKVYILSALQADNEANRLFMHNQTIDVYDGDTGQYLNSFHVPRYNGNKITTFLMKGEDLYGIFDDLLVKFKILH